MSRIRDVDFEAGRKCESRGLDVRLVRCLMIEQWEARQEHWLTLTAIRLDAFGQLRTSKANRAFRDGDANCLPGLDVIAADLARQHPWLERGGDATDSLFSLLRRSKGELRPCRASCWRDAMERAETAEHDGGVEFPYGANLAF